MSELDYARRNAAQEEEHAQKETERRLDSAQIPPRFRGKSFADYQVKNPAQQRVLDTLAGYATDFQEHRTAGRCLTLLGGVGSGKTHLACAILRQLASHRFPKNENRQYQQVGYGVQYTTAPKVIRELRATWHNKSETTEQQVLEGFVAPALLVIDEVGVGFGTEGERAQLSELINARYEAVKPTLVVSNLDREGLKQFLGDRAVDRLLDNGGFVVLFDWGSYRQ